MQSETVVLLHGLGRSPLAMAGLARYLRRQGYRVINQGYPSRLHAIPELCSRLAQDLLPRLVDVPRVHFVTHSLGGILLRYGLQHWPLSCGQLGRAVMLAPPNQGSEVVDQLRRWPLVPRIMGPAFLQLGTDDASVPLQLLLQDRHELPLEVGIIAGTRSIDPWSRRWLPDQNDGKVSVTSSRHPAMRDFCVLDVNHTFIMNDARVRKQIVHFLQNGKFSQQEPQS